MTSGRRIEGITFDFWNTLIAESRSADHRTQRWTAALERAGHHVDPERFEAGIGAMWQWFLTEWESNRPVTPERATDYFVQAAGIPHDPVLRADMVQALHDGFDPAEMELAPGIGDALEALKARGLRVGIICDVGVSPSSTLRRYLAHHGLLQHFDHWSFSDEVGCYKPDQRIFAHALGGLGVASATAMAHIGDLRRTDIAGAREAGWLALRYSGLHDDQCEGVAGDVVVADPADLPVGLGL